MQPHFLLVHLWCDNMQEQPKNISNFFKTTQEDPIKTCSSSAYQISPDLPTVSSTCGCYNDPQTILKDISSVKSDLEWSTSTVLCLHTASESGVMKVKKLTHRERCHWPALQGESEDHCILTTGCRRLTAAICWPPSSSKILTPPFVNPTASAVALGCQPRALGCISLLFPSSSSEYVQSFCQCNLWHTIWSAYAQAMMSCVGQILCSNKSLSKALSSNKVVSSILCPKTLTCRKESQSSMTTLTCQTFWFARQPRSDYYTL